MDKSSILGNLAKSVLIFIVGTVATYIFRNVIVVTVITFVLGLVLFSGRKGQPESSTQAVPVLQQTREARRPQTITAPQNGGVSAGTTYCQKCGAEMLLDDQFCPNCGVRQNISKEPLAEDQARNYPPEDIMIQFKKMRELYLRGLIGKERYSKIIKNAVLVDEWGGYWYIGVKTLKWYRNDGGVWVPDQPMGNLIITGRNEIRARVT